MATVARPTLTTSLKGNESLFNQQELDLLEKLIYQGQSHIFEHWTAPGIDDDNKKRMVAQLTTLDTSYPGGLVAYITNAKTLLKDSKEGKNPFDGYTPAVPEGEKMDFGSEKYLQLEAAGLKELPHTAFVLVAGGLGERLGYSGIKVALPYECATRKCFLGLYCEYILALQARSNASQPLPLVIMTSGDTHDRTVALIEANKNFGMAPGQITLLKQEKVACLIDNDAHMALDPHDNWAIQTKPHGHGDVHSLLYLSGTVKKWRASGFKWVCFFQDTNALVFRGMTAALGVSAVNDYDMNSLAVPRKAKEAIGAIALLRHTNGSCMTINVEYNQLDPLLRSTINPDGDVNDESGWSPFPGNLNQLVIKVSSYDDQLEVSKGVISEFVNPKYKDSTKTAFKSSTRLECMMQDYPKALPTTAKVGFTVINQVWASYSPVKNSPADARAKQADNGPTHSATSGEMDVYKANAMMLRDLCGCDVGEAKTEVFNGINVEVWPKVVLSPSFVPLVGDVKDKVKPGSIKLHPDSVLIIDGTGVRIEGPLDVNGSFVVKAAQGSELVVCSRSVSNAGWIWEPLKEGVVAKEEDAIRGFTVAKNQTDALCAGDVPM